MSGRLGTGVFVLGDQYGRLEVIADLGSRAGERWVRCRCTCGVFKDLQLKKARKAVACGCLEQTRKITHGASDTPEYRTWTHIIDRCYNPRCDDYPNWGGRGIKMHPAWRRDFAVFLAAVGKRPGPGYSLDRRDNSKGYVPGNVRWATKKQQARNMRTNRVLKFLGRAQPLAAWAEELGISQRTLLTRLSRGFSVERALKQPVARKDQSWRSSL